MRAGDIESETQRGVRRRERCAAVAERHDRQHKTTQVDISKDAR